MNRIKVAFLSLVLVLSILPAQNVLADVGPKPTMEFDFKGLQDGELQIISGILFECDQPDCSDAAPLEELGPQRLDCNTVGCHALAYGFAPYHILEVEFSDEVIRRSNIFETAGFNSRYTVTIQPDDLLVEKRFTLGIVGTSTLVLGCVCVLGIGGITAIVVFLTRRSAKK